MPENLPAENSPESNEFPTTSNKSENLSQIKYDTLILSKTDNLNIRSGPSTSSTVLGIINKGDMISFSGKENSWYTTVYKQRKAYVSASENLTCLYNFPIASEAIEKVIEIGKTLIGYPYVWGSERYLYSNGTLNSSFKQGKFDCSALMQYIYYIGAGIKLDVTTRTQVLQGMEIHAKDLKRGDLMFFTNSSRYYNSGIERIGHVAMYLGENRILHTASDYAIIEEISSTRWNYFITAKRVI